MRVKQCLFFTTDIQPHTHIHDHTCIFLSAHSKHSKCPVKGYKRKRNMFLFHFSNSNVTFQGLKRWQIKIKLSPTAKCFRNLLDVYCPQGGLSTSINGIINHISRGPFHPGGPHSFSAIYWPIQPIYHWMPGFHRIVHAGACEPPLFWCFLPPKQGRISNQKKGQLGSSFFFLP